MNGSKIWCSGERVKKLLNRAQIEIKAAALQPEQQIQMNMSVAPNCFCWAKTRRGQRKCIGHQTLTQWYSCERIEQQTNSGRTNSWKQISPFFRHTNKKANKLVNQQKRQSRWKQRKRGYGMEGDGSEATRSSAVRSITLAERSKAGHKEVS